MNKGVGAPLRINIGNKLIDTNNQNTVDTRVLKSGHTRLRFKLTDSILVRFEIAKMYTEFIYDNAALDAICQEYICSYEHYKHIAKESRGTNRFLVKLYPDQYEVVKFALTLARQYSKSDTEALDIIIRHFLALKKHKFLFT